MRTPDPPRWRLDRPDMTPRGRRPTPHPTLVIFMLAALTMLVVAATLAWGADNSLTPTQSGVNRNSSNTSTASASQTVTLTPPTNQAVHLYGISAFCSAGTATATITNGGTTVWTSSPGWVASGSIVSYTWTPAPLTGTRNAAMAITISDCGAANTSTVNVQADIY